MGIRHQGTRRRHGLQPRYEAERHEAELARHKEDDALRLFANGARRPGPNAARPVLGDASCDRAFHSLGQDIEKRRGQDSGQHGEREVQRRTEQREQEPTRQPRERPQWTDPEPGVPRLRLGTTEPLGERGRQRIELTQEEPDGGRDR